MSINVLYETELTEKVEEIRKTKVTVKTYGNELMKPEVPVMSMNTRKVEKFMPELVNAVHEKHNIMPEKSGVK